MFSQSTDLSSLASALSARCGMAVQVLAHTDSTNQQLLSAPSQTQEMRALLTLSQSAGRGRMGRAWVADTRNTTSVSPAFLGSVAAYTTLSLRELSTLPLRVGVAVAQYLRTMGCAAGVKWPNDIVIGDAKLGGILIETRPHADGVWAVMGLGLNWHAAPEIVGRETQCLAQSLGTNPLPQPNVAAAGLILALQAAWQAAHARAALDFAAVDTLHGRTVSSLNAAGEPQHTGVAQGINAAGELGIRDAAKGTVHWIHSGELSVRALNVV